jgi:hypothetical protein
MAAGGVHSGLAAAATASLLRAHDLSAGMEEDADYTALAYAGVLALLETAEPLRLVLAADVEPSQLDDLGGDFGEVALHDVRWDQVRAFFADESASRDAIVQARALAAGMTLAETVDQPEIESLLDGCDLLWFAPDELVDLPHAYPG